MFGSELSRIRFDGADGCIRLYDGIRYFVLFTPEKDDNYNRIRYLMSQKSGITYAFSHNYEKTKTDLCDSLPLGKMLIFL